MNIVITIDEHESVYVLKEMTIDVPTKPKQQQKSSKDKNADLILTNKQSTKTVLLLSKQ